MPQQQQQGQAAAAGSRKEESSFMSSAIRSIVMFVLVQAVVKYLTSGNQSSSNGEPAKATIPEYSARPAMQPGGEYSAVPKNIVPMWSPDTSLDISMYISPSLIMPSLKKLPRGSKIFEEKDFTIGDKSDSRTISTTFDVPKEVQHNATLWGHFYVGHSGAVLDPTDSEYNVAKAFHFFWPLTQHLQKKKVRKTKNLLSSGNETALEEETPVQKGPQPIVSHWHPNFTVSVIPDSGAQQFGAIHPSVRQYYQLESTGARDATGQNGWYYPVFFVNTFWQLREHMIELNSTVEQLTINIDLNHQANWIFSLVATMDEGMKQTQRNAAQGISNPGGGDGSEMEEVKRILIDSNPYLLATTGVVTILHMIFELLAFKSDVSHWRKKKDNVGTSFRTILANVVMQTIIFLYLMDNNENTSWMILFSSGTGIVIEAWKITKTVNVRIRRNPAGSLIPYSIRFEDKHQLSETEKKTQEYDQIAFKYLYIVAVPLLLAYAGYSLFYDTHKSWYSFIITTLVGSVYAYGFLMMVPSLYINYRLKSVAHMPGKAMMYKCLNTFIDDLFAFTIKMPFLHRLATLRDDVIFFVYLYQMWVYKVDYTRVNEFGQGGDDEEAEEKTANKPLAAPPAADGSVKLAADAAKKADAKVTDAAKSVGEKVTDAAKSTDAQITDAATRKRK